MVGIRPKVCGAHYFCAFNTKLHKLFVGVKWYRYLLFLGVMWYRRFLGVMWSTIYLISDIYLIYTTYVIHHLCDIGHLSDIWYVISAIYLISDMWYRPSIWYLISDIWYRPSAGGRNCFARDDCGVEIANPGSRWTVQSDIFQFSFTLSDFRLSLIPDFRFLIFTHSQFQNFDFQSFPISDFDFHSFQIFYFTHSKFQIFNFHSFPISNFWSSLVPDFRWWSII